MTNDLLEIRKELDGHLDAVLAEVAAGNGAKALSHVVEAKEIMHRIYYVVWHTHHTSGVVNDK
jgi:hypothetical protein